MNPQYFQDGMAIINKHFTTPYTVENMRTIWLDIKDMPDEALVAAQKRIEQEYHPKHLIPIGKIKDMIIVEGKKILGKQAVEREEEAEAEKRKFRSLHETSFNSLYGRDCAALVLSMLDDETTAEQKIQGIARHDKKYPGRGWDDCGRQITKDMMDRGELHLKAV